MQTFGETFKAMRKSKLLTLNDIELQTGITSSFISRFERNKTDITISKLTRIVNAINVTLPEFLVEYYADNNNMHPFDADEAALAALKTQAPFITPFLKFQRITNATKDLIATEIERTRQQYQTAPTRSNHFIYLFYQVITAVVSESDDTIATSELLRLSHPVTHYLYQVDTWGEYEIYLFQFFASVISADDTLRLLRIGLKHISHRRTDREYHGMAFRLITSTFTSQLALHHFDLATQIIYTADNYPGLDANEAIHRIFFHGWLKIKTGDRRGETECTRAINLLVELGLEAQATPLKKILANILRNPDYNIILISFNQE